MERANADVKEMLATWLSENNSTQWYEGIRFIQFPKNRSYHRVIGLSSSSVPTAISETEHSTDTETETETDATMSEMDNITDTNTDTDGQVTAHNSTDNNEPTIELETETMVIE